MERNNLDLTNSNLLGEEFSNAKGWLKNLASNVKKGFEDAGKNIKGAVKDAGKSIKGAVGDIKKAGKKAVAKLKDKAGKLGKNFRNRFRGVMRNAITMNIKKNIHGLATKLYPAIASESEITSKKYKPSFVSKAKKIYGKVLKKWVELGGKEEDLKSAIKDGQGKRFLKLPYKSAMGNDLEEFYSYVTPDMGIYYGDDGSVFCNVDGEENEETGVEEIPDEQEQKSGLRAFFAFILNIFRKEGADENPFEEGSTENADFTNDKKEDEGNQPAPSEENNEVLTTLTDSSRTDDVNAPTADDKTTTDGGTDDKFLGMPRKVGIAVAVIGGLALVVGGVMLVKKMRK